jgi:hypothetical protein
LTHQSSCFRTTVPFICVLVGSSPSAPQMLLKVGYAK